jgi:transcriptional regulator with XRE-family HTH domain
LAREGSKIQQREMAKKPDQNGGMEQFQVGARIRHARVLKGMRMKDLAESVGYDESMISKIEAGKVMPSLPMLNRIVTALDRDLASFFGLQIDEHKLVQSSRDRLRVEGDALRGGKGVSYERMVPIAAGNLLEANIHVVEPGGEKNDPITHQGETTGYLIEGEIEFTIDGTVYQMKAGDSFFFKAYLTNSYRNTGSVQARMIWVNTPQIH